MSSLRQVARTGLSAVRSGDAEVVDSEMHYLNFRYSEGGPVVVTGDVRNTSNQSVSNVEITVYFWTWGESLVRKSVASTGPIEAGEATSFATDTIHVDQKPFGYRLIVQAE